MGTALLSAEGGIVASKPPSAHLRLRSIMALPYTTLALIFLAIVATALSRATFAEANGEVSKKHDANANATAPASPATAPQPAQAPAVPPSTATPPTGGRVQIPPELKNLLPSLPPSAEPQEIKELISKATGVDPSKIPEITDPKQIEDIITQAAGVKPSDALAAFQESGGLEAILTTGALS